MRMGRINIPMPDDLIAKARALGLNVSRLAAAAVTQEVRRAEKIEYIDRFLAEFDQEHGPISEHEMTEAQAWVDRVTSGFPALADKQKAA